MAPKANDLDLEYVMKNIQAYVSSNDQLEYPM